VLTLRSNNNIVIPPAKTGRLKTKRKAVTHTLTKNKGILNQLSVGTLRLFMVHKKFTEPAMDLTPAKCKLKITKSTVLLACPKYPLKGG
jgi:hypothetical protein